MFSKLKYSHSDTKLLSCDPVKLFAACLFIFVFAAFLAPKAYADKLVDSNLRAYIDGAGPVDIDAYDGDYENNTFVSLRSMAGLLKDTSKAYTCTYGFDEASQLGCMYIQTGQSSNADAGAASSPSFVRSSLNLNYLVVDGAERRYWTYRANDDLYMSLTDFAMLFDVSITYFGPNTIAIRTDKPYSTSLRQLNAIGYFDLLSGIVVGDITSGEIIFAENEDHPEAIASTTKLMTCLLLLDAVDEGRISFDDTVTISNKAEQISQSDDGQIPLYAGQGVSLYDLLAAMMLPSSNESCIAIAEYLEGGEANFVNRMNDKAKELGLTTARFYNATGLPYFRETAALSKSHNKMSAMDLYRLAQALVDKHPEITDITSQKSIYLESMGCAAINSNPLLYNLPNVWGLKTGTTNRAGCCLVSLMKVDADDGPHLILCVLLDAETSGERCTKSEMLLRCVQSMYNN